MSKWQYDLLFGLFAIGAVFLMLAKSVFGLEIEPTALTGYGALTTYVLTQRTQWTKKTGQSADSKTPESVVSNPHPTDEGSRG